MTRGTGFGAALATFIGTRAARSGAGAAIVLAAALLCGCGKSDPIAAARGDWVFINYWATWCKPCRREIPELNALHEMPGFTVLGVNYDGAVGDALAEEEAALAIAFPTLGEDPARRYAVERPQVLPTTLVINPGGGLEEVLVGPQTVDSLRRFAGDR
jgi:thiol-disulfide isomerase/thioredoxin